MSPSGTVYVSDFNSANHRSRILAVTSTGRVTTFADEAAATWDAGFRAISVDASGTVYAVSGQEIRKFGVDGRMSTLAGKTEVGSLNTPARVKDGIGTEARFDTVLGMAVSPSGNLYVTDSGQVRKITPQGKVTTLATCAAGVTDCLGWPGTIAVDAGGTIYIGSDDYMIRRITPAGQVTVMAVGDTTSGTGLFHRMTLAVDPTNATLLAADTLGLHKIAPDGTVTSVATAKAGRFGPMTVATNGTLYAVADQNVIVTMGPT